MDLPVNRIIMLASSYGLLTAPKPSEFTHIPFSLTPAIFPHENFTNLISDTPEFSKMMYNVSKNPEYLYKILENVCEIDEFTKRLVQISKKSKAHGSPQSIFLGISRNDFMFDTCENRFVQVEFNTIAASFVTIGSKIVDFHKHVLGFQGETGVLDNPALDKFGEALELAYELYGKKGVVLFVVLPDEKNLFDQTGLELELWKRNILVIRASLEEIQNEATIAENGELLFKGQEIAIVYYRSAYVPEQYPTEACWAAREKIELSKAVKCPNIDFHLAGCKKIQQSLSSDMSLFTNTPTELLSTTTEIYDFCKITPEIVQRVKNDPKDWVLKPQREGGGNNTYGEAILEKLERFVEHPEYILMKMIKCGERECTMFRAGVEKTVMAVSEVGMFGVMVEKDGEIVRNEYGGYLVRTKSKDSNEGGVAAGYAVIDSARLVR